MKPVKCEDCPAVEKEKTCIICGCMRSLKASSYEEKTEMWNRCPLKWEGK